MWLPEFIRIWKREHQRKKAEARILYAARRLSKPHYSDLDNKDTKFTREILEWMYQYYRGNADALGEGSPDIRLRKILSKPSCDLTRRDHVYTKILYHWVTFNRVEGF